ncbi:MAG TPA: thiamine phosphate synthase [Dokdonella sp.]|uniref:thiamine phosphate synthase n=1 Tax=Dokdonella sp. TaxID=2291710 RepID=UPI002D7FEB73|nr:thiamine phosphate synthase [Dokdonella sp.]HET9031720.1 thiamine phosphate synthase [Dokdonella sp.]
MFKARGLYAITNGPRADLQAVVGAALRGGANVIQYRDKTTDKSRRLNEATSLARLCWSHNVPLIINDDIDLAIECGAAGVHLGAEDIGLSAARARLGDKAIIGVSCYDSLALARHAVEDGADYIAFGAFHPSPTKPLARCAKPDLLVEARSFGVPVVAIGGITPDNAGALIAAGADCVAVISSLFDAPDIESAARRFSQLFP